MEARQAEIRVPISPVRAASSRRGRCVLAWRKAERIVLSLLCNVLDPVHEEGVLPG